MSYRIPKDERLIDAIFSVTYRNQQIRSQSELVDLVRKELEKDGVDYRVSNERVRKTALRNHLVSIHIDYNETDDPLLPETCPVCGSPMRAVENMTLYGERKELGRICSSCPYSVGSKRRVPGRYTFTKLRR